jgi:hypothetical protein
MPKDEIKTDINKVLDQFSDETLKGLLIFLKKLEDKHSDSVFNNKNLDKFLNEDKDFLDRLEK